MTDPTESAAAEWASASQQVSYLTPRLIAARAQLAKVEAEFAEADAREARARAAMRAVVR